jgi:hypothetical protein
MDTARDVHTLELVEGEELWNMATVDKEGYICRGCPQQVFPASYVKDVNKKRPYFTLGPVNKHLANCDVDGEEVILKRAKKETVGTPEGYPLPFPNRLVLTDERIIEPDDQEPTGTAGRARTPGTGEGAENARRKYHGHTVKTIRNICRRFMQLPNDRATMPLTIPGVEGGTYAKVFKYVRGKPGLLEGTRLFYAPVRWAEEPTITKEYCELTLSAGEWDETSRRFTSMYRVRVNWASWSKSRQDILIREYEATRREAREQTTKNKNVKGWLFFVGAPDAADPSVFLVDNHRLICSLSGAIDWPK